MEKSHENVSCRYCYRSDHGHLCACRHRPEWLFLERSLDERRLAERRLRERPLAEWHLVERYLAKWRLAERCLPERPRLERPDFDCGSSCCRCAGDRLR